MGMKSYLTAKKMYLSWMTRWHFLKPWDQLTQDTVGNLKIRVQINSRPLN